jgi:predicted MPP superfamily phosphohydrolase
MAAVAAIFLGAAGVAVYWLVAKLRRRPANLSRAAKIILVAGAIGLGCVADGFIEPYWPAVTHVEIKTNKFPKGSSRVRIVQISDLHSETPPRLEEKLPAIIAKQKPDLIVFTGDSVNDAEAIGLFRTLMSALARIAPTYVVRGNWDPADRSQALFGDTGVTELQGIPVRLKFGGNSIVISGTATDDPISVHAALLYIPKSEFRIFVHHFPDRIYEVAREEVDLYLAGHTHGGQVALPIYGALVTFSRFDKQFEAGLYTVDKTRLYVNRGIGLEGGRAPRVRFWSRPEITVLDIVPE